MKLEFSTKAGTLSLLNGKIISAAIPDSKSFTYSEWVKDTAGCLKQLRDAFADNLMIVRSSCGREDGADHSNAGAFLSLPNVTHEGLAKSIDAVFNSYGDLLPSDEILIQPMLRDVIRSGVAFSHDPNTCSPYRVINWSEGQDTSEVTGGLGGKVWQQAACVEQLSNNYHSPVIEMIDELLLLFGNRPLDTEFAITLNDGKEMVWLLQVRPLILSDEAELEEQQSARLNLIKDRVSKGMKPHPFLMGRRTVYGVMPDWNPAEIIGIRPKPLALSLYRELITDSIWAYQRNNYGYRNLRSFPLMPHFFGQPYIDVRLSFNSFIPADLDDGLAGRLVDYYIDRLLDEPALHDKVEFEIVYSCYTLDLPARLQQLKANGFSNRDCGLLAESLRKLTNRILHPKSGLWLSDANRITILQERHEKLMSSNADPLEKIYWLLEDCKRYGTLPFAGLARAGFVAVQLLRSLVNVGVFSETDYDNFIGSVSTVSGSLTRDRTSLDKSTFLSRYGHLRPGTYDILSPRYDEAPDMYFDWSYKPPTQRESQPFSVTLDQLKKTATLLNEHKLEIAPSELFEFIRSGIELRESAKFHFTKNLSDALALIGDLGSKYGFSRDELAYCDIATIYELHSAAADAKELISRSIETGKNRYSDTLKLSLPPLISNPEDVLAFELPEADANFITQKQVTAKIADHTVRDAISGSIVCIPNADPGFDWLFSYPIAGLITAWGGANSHMAIRAGELGLPAVIGAGDVSFRKWSSAKNLFIDCAGRRVEILE